MSRIRLIGNILIGVVVLAGLSGCSYGTRSGLPEHIKTIHVEMFRNTKTLYKGLETKLTAGIIAKLQNEPTVHVVNNGGDATIRGEIIDVKRTVYRETRKDRPATVGVSVLVSFSFFDEVEQRAIIESKKLSSSESSSTAGLYEVDRGELQASAEEAAVKQLAKEIVRQTVGMW